MQTREDRIFAHYSALRNKLDTREEGGSSRMWMKMAGTWKMSIRELKDIVYVKKTRNKREHTR